MSGEHGTVRVHHRSHGCDRWWTACTAGDLHVHATSEAAANEAAEAHAWATGATVELIVRCAP